MLIWIYRLLFLPVVLASLPRYYFHMKKRGGYKESFSTRFGRGLVIPQKKEGVRRVWIQAVSLGEMLAIEPLIRRLSEDERIEIYLTVTTSTGYALAKDRYSQTAIGISYFPLDFYPFSNRVWNAIQADIAICAETELWPEHMRQATKRRVPFLLVNARLSDASFRRARQFRWLFKGTLRQISRVYASSELDRDRFLELGLPENQVELTGNMKVDVVIEPILSQAERANLKAELGLGDGFVLLGSSTWPGEEAMLLKAFAGIRAKRPNAKLLIVPRHAERRDEIRKLLETVDGSLAYHFKSSGPAEGAVDVLIADTHGELRTLTQIADLAFVGKSLPPHREGQTPVECGALGVPMALGPGMSNFRSIRAGLRQFGAIREVENETEAIETLMSLSDDAATRAAMGAAGKNWHRSNKGAVERTVEGIRTWL